MLRRKTAPYSRRKYRKALHRWLLANWLPLAVAMVIFAVTMAAIPLFVDGYFLGAIHGLLVGLLVLAITTSFLVHTSSAGQLAGAWGEEFTREELAKAKRRRLIWGWVDSIERNGADVDHLVLMRSGNVVAIDSKWRRDADDEDRLHADAEAAKRSARRAAAVLSQLESTKSVRALVAVWGAAQGDLHGRKVGGVEFISGRKLRVWLREHQSKSCDRSTADSLLRELKSHQRSAMRPQS
jgi:hypothetical protein